MTPKPWTQPWLPGLLAGLIILALVLTGVLRPLEERLYGGLMRLEQRAPGDDIVVVGIGRDSAAHLGEMLPSRDTYARVLQRLSEAYPRLIALPEFFAGPQEAPGSRELADLMLYYEGSGLVNEFHCATPEQSYLNQEVAGIGTRLNNIHAALDADRRLAQALEGRGNTILGLPFAPGNAAAPTVVQKYRLQRVIHRFEHPAQARQPPQGQLDPLFQPFAEAAAGLAAWPAPANFYKTPLVVRVGDEYYPTLPLLLASRLASLPLNELELRLGTGIRLGSRSIPTDPWLALRPFIYGENDRPGFRVVPFYRVYNGEADFESLSDKVILLGSLLPGPQELDAFAAGTFIPPVLRLAHTVASLRNGDFLYEPRWSRAIQGILIVAVALYLALFAPAARRVLSVSLTLALAVALGGLQFFLFSGYNLWLPLLSVLFALLLGHALVVLRAVVMHYQEQARFNSEAVIQNRLEGLACQGQGKLELAFERFAQCPPDDLIMSLLYNLGLDFERKRQLKQALAVYRYMSSHDPRFRDLEQRMARLAHNRKTPLVSSTTLNEWLDDGELDVKPTLGRYQIERRLAKGAMGGDVYLGKDPKLDRMVALKTLALSQEFEGEELEEATTRFFREAAAAGRLNHPNIIAVYDAGEENDLAYISMEFFKGGDLAPYTQPDNRLPLDEIARIVSTAAEALDFAHSQGVVHRDIKPANILYNHANGNLKLTDFGIARIMDTKKTKTGIILGTPSYMSPEQLSGKVVDGRSDLFSLGVTLYQLVTGSLPFTADSMASLMFKIASEPHPDVDRLCPEAPECLRRIIDTLLAKDPSQRYANGAELAAGMRACIPSPADERDPAAISVEQSF